MDIVFALKHVLQILKTTFSKDTFAEASNMLSDVDIENAMRRGDIRIEPWNPDTLGPCSVDFTLDDVFRIYEHGPVVDIMADKASLRTNLVKTDDSPFQIRPGQFVLGQTRETISLSTSYAALLEGKSSIARLGIIVHAAGLVNPGTGMNRPTRLTLEIFCENPNPVLLYPGMQIVQATFIQLSSPTRLGYDSRPKSRFVASDSPDIR